MIEYSDYGYKNNHYNHIHNYLLGPILKMLKENNSKNILDLGCGNGWLTNILLQKGYNAYGTDASETGIKIAQEKNADRFFLQDLSKDCLPKELEQIQFDTLISTEVIEHLYSPKSYFQFCKKVLQKNRGGSLIVTTPYHGYFKNVVLALTGKMDAHFTVNWDGGHINFWSKKTLTNALKQNDFNIKEFVGCGRMPYLWKSMLVKSELIIN